MLLIWYLIYIFFLFDENQLLVLSWDSNAADWSINYAGWSISILIWLFIIIIDVVLVTKLQIDTNGTGNGNNRNDFVANDDKISDAKTLETGNKVNKQDSTTNESFLDLPHLSHDPKIGKRLVRWIVT